MGDSKFLAGAGGGLAISGGILRHKAAQNAADAQADAARHRAKQDIRDGAVEEARLRRFANRALSAEFVSGTAGAGLVDVGSPNEFRAFNAAELEIEAASARIEAQESADLERTLARNAEKAGDVRSGAAILSGLSQAAFIGLSLR